MVKFSQNEIKYIKEQFSNMKAEINKSTKEELLELIEDVGGDTVDTILFMNKHEDLYNVVNTNKNINKRVLDGIYWYMGMWVWVDAYMETAEEVFEYIGDITYCKLFEKIITDK